MPLYFILIDEEFMRNSKKKIIIKTRKSNNTYIMQNPKFSLTISANLELAYVLGRRTLGHKIINL